MKKILSVGLCFLLTLSFASCGNDDRETLSLVSCVNDDRENAQKAYELLVDAEKICIEGMDDIYGAWHFGLYDAGEYTSSEVFDKLALRTSFSAYELKDNGGWSGEYLVEGDGELAGWEFCLYAVENCLEARGDFDRVDLLLEESKKQIQLLGESYEYTVDFKNYYTKVSSYAEFFKNVTGSFKQLQTTITEYENGIRTAKEVFRFEFE